MSLENQRFAENAGRMRKVLLVMVLLIPATALSDAETASAGEPDAGATLDSLGRAEFRAGRYRKAKSYFDRSLAVNRDRPEARLAALSNAGQAYLALEEYGRAEQLFREALQLGPDHAALWQFLGKVLFLRHRYADAEAAQYKALSLVKAGQSEVAAAARNDLAILYQARKRPRAAISLLEDAAAATQPGQARARIFANLGVLQWKYGSKQDAAMYLRRALSEMETAVGPEHPDVGKILEDYGDVLRATGEKAVAKHMAKRAAAIRSAFAAQTNNTGTTVDWRDLK
jgi:Tfp pilus assembly protein PilF